jgi:hypothetical protein
MPWAAADAHFNAGLDHYLAAGATGSSDAMARREPAAILRLAESLTAGTSEMRQSTQEVRKENDL